MVPGEDPARALDNALLEVATVAPTDDDVLADVAADGRPAGGRDRPVRGVLDDAHLQSDASAFLATLTAAVIDGCRRPYGS